MGNLSSKQSTTAAATAKNVFKQATTAHSSPVMPSARNTAAEPTATSSSPSSTPQFSHDKSPSIVQDGQDPTFMANLSQLGQVQVPRSRFAIRTDNSMIDIMQSRKAIEQQQLDEDANPTRKSNSVQHHLTARTLSNLFDERKTAKTEQDMRELAKEYQFDFDLLEQLARHYNAPSISQKLPPKSVEDDTETHLACWVDPDWKQKPESERAQIASS